MISQALLFTMSFRQSLKRWHNMGLFDREILLLNKLVEKGHYGAIWILSYDYDDHAFLAACQADGRISGHVHVVTPPRALAGLCKNPIGALVYSVLAPFSVMKVLPRDAFVIRNNQVSGVWTALLLQRLSKRPFIFRCGYSLSKRLRFNGSPIKAFIAAQLERLALRSCTLCVVSAEDIKDYYSSLVPQARIVVNPTFVDADLFRSRDGLNARDPLLYVGRLEPQKNVESLIEACAELGAPLHVYGDGTLRSKLEQQARNLGAKVEFRGVVTNSELSEVHQQHSIYVLPSLTDPMPKTLIEAMASGLICVATPTAGAVELIEDGHTGLLTAGFSASDIANGLRRAITELPTQLGAAARTKIVDRNSLDGFVNQEVGAFADQTMPASQAAG